MDLEKIFAELEERVREVIRDTGHGRVCLEIVIRDGKPEVSIEKILTRRI